MLISTAANAAEQSVLKGLSYSSADSQLKMDLYLPQQAVGTVPCVMVIQGGGFKSQDGQKFISYAKHLAENGFAAALIAYRGRPDDTYQTTISDTKTAVRFVRSISSQYKINPDRIGAMGRSAGATLAALLAVTGGVLELEENSEHSQFSSRIQAAAGISGVYDFIARFTQEEQLSLQPQLDTKLVSNGEWIGAPFSITNEHWLRASAVNHIDVMDPPMLLIHSLDDSTVPWMQSRDMHTAMTEKGIQAEIEYGGTGGHAGPENAMELMVAFFQKNLAE